MAKKLTGVGGVLGGLISEEIPAPSSRDHREPAEEVILAPDVKKSPDPESSGVRPRGARLGRPPGPQTGQGTRKEKTTLRLDKQLMDDYRNWSWEERCQIGELVERALIEYRKKHLRR